MISQRNRYLSCKASEVSFAIALENLREVHHLMRWNAVPHAPEYVCGVLSLRGETHMVLDAGRILCEQRVARSDQARLLFFKDHVAPPYALLVSKVGSFVHCKPGLLVRAPESAAADASLFEQAVEGFGSFDETQVPIVSPTKLYTTIANKIKARAEAFASTAIASGVRS